MFSNQTARSSQPEMQNKTITVYTSERLSQTEKKAIPLGKAKRELMSQSKLSYSMITVDHPDRFRSYEKKNTSSCVATGILSNRANSLPTIGKQLQLYKMQIRCQRCTDLKVGVCIDAI